MLGRRFAGKTYRGRGCRKGGNGRGVDRGLLEAGFEAGSHPGAGAGGLGALELVREGRHVPARTQSVSVIKWVQMLARKRESRLVIFGARDGTGVMAEWAKPRM